MIYDFYEYKRSEKELSFAFESLNSELSSYTTFQKTFDRLTSYDRATESFYEKLSLEEEKKEKGFFGKMLDKIIGFFKRIGQWFAKVYYKIWAFFLVKRFKKAMVEARKNPEAWVSKNNTMTNFYMLMYVSFIAREDGIYNLVESIDKEVLQKIRITLMSIKDNISRGKAPWDDSDGDSEFLDKSNKFKTIGANIAGSVLQVAASVVIGYVVDSLKYFNDGIAAFAIVKDFKNVSQIYKTTRKILVVARDQLKSKMGGSNYDNVMKTIKFLNLDPYTPLKLLDDFIESEKFKEVQKIDNEEMVKERLVKEIQSVGEAKIIGFHKSMAKMSMTLKNEADDIAKLLDSMKQGGVKVNNGVFKTLNAAMNAWNEVVRFLNFITSIGKKALTTAGIELKEEGEVAE